MRGTYRILCAILLLGSLLLSGCAPLPNTQGQTQPTDPTSPTQPSGATQPADTAPTADTTVPTDAPEDPSLAVFRQSMVETPQLFAAAYFGYSAQDADPFAVMAEAAPQLCGDLSFLLGVREENIVGTSGYLFCIVPADENATVAVNRRLWNPETERYGDPEVLYRSETGEPILVMCPNDNWMPDTEVVITDSLGNIAVWYPHLDSSYCLAPLCDDSGESLIFDFTAYDEVPVPVWDPGIDASGLVGTWQRIWTEVEGDRNETAPGDCTVEIAAVEADLFRLTYTDRNYPEENLQNRELTVVPGELYPGCGNHRWIAEVTEESGDTGRYCLTLLEDGTLLLQISWDMDGIPMVSYGCFARIG